MTTLFFVYRLLLPFQPPTFVFRPTRPSALLSTPSPPSRSSPSPSLSVVDRARTPALAPPLRAAANTREDCTRPRGWLGQALKRQVTSAERLLFNMRTPPFLPTAVFLLSRLPFAVLAQIGTAMTNISSDSTQMSYVGSWRSETDAGVYEAYSNATNATVTFSFTGVGASYVAVKKDDRGLCQLVLDGNQAYTVDLYDDSGFAQYQTVIWTSPTLPYGNHSVTIQQIGPDARFGFYPYLFTETWIEVVPTDVAAYTATQILTTATTGSNPTSTSSSTSSSFSSVNVAPIVGGAVGGVVALGLIAFLVFLWRKDKASSARGGGRIIQKVKKAEGKMSIEDDVAGGGGQPAYTGLNYGPLAETGAEEGGRATGYGRGYSLSSGEQAPSSWGHGGGEGYSARREDAYGAGGYQISAPTRPTSGFDAGGWGEQDGTGTAGSRDSRSYPYHTQGDGEARRNYPVPEI